MNVLHKQIKEKIDTSEHILLLTDERIDGDTIGSTLGMYYALQETGKKVSVFSPKPMAKMLEFIPGVELIERDAKIFKDSSIDLVMIFDCGDGEYIKDFLPMMARRVPLVVFDHHLVNPNYGTINLVDSTAAATASIVWRFIKDVKMSVNNNVVQCLLTGICADTNLFATSNTTSICLNTAHELSEKGAKFKDVAEKLMMNRDLTTLKLWGLAFERLHHNKHFGVMTTVITQQDIKELHVQEADTKSMINFLNMALDGVDTILLLKEVSNNVVKGSLRSQTEDCIAFAEKYGGGGHRRAAGFKIMNSKLVKKDEEWGIIAV